MIVAERKTIPEIMEIVKSFVGESNKGLTEDDKDFVLNNFPEKVGFYKMTSDYGQYFWSWNTAKGRRVRVYGTGSLSDLGTKTNTWLNISIIKEN